MPKFEIAEIEKQLKACLAPQRLDRCGRQNGLEQRRHRGISSSRLVVSLLNSLGSRRIETLADLHRDFQAANASTVNYKPFYEKLDRPGFGRVMKAVFESILRQLTPKVIGPSKSSPLRGFDDVILHDGTSLSLHEDLRSVFPSRFTKCHPAGAGLHVTMSLWQQSPLKVQIAPDRESERNFPPPAASLRNKLLLADRGYDGLSYLSEVDRAGGFFAVRIKSQGTPIIERVLSGSKHMRRHVGRRLDVALARAPKSECADLIVTFSRRGDRGPCTYRLIVERLRNPRKDHKHSDTWMRVLTNVGAERLSKSQVLLAYRLRWQIELAFKRPKGQLRLADIQAKDPRLARACILAKLILALLADRLVAGHRRPFRRGPALARRPPCGA